MGYYTQKRVLTPKKRNNEKINFCGDRRFGYCILR